MVAALYIFFQNLPNDDDSDLGGAVIQNAGSNGNAIAAKTWVQVPPTTSGVFRL